MTAVLKRETQIIGGNDTWESYAEFLTVREITHFYNDGFFRIVPIPPSYSHINDEWHKSSDKAYRFFHFTLNEQNELRYLRQRLFHASKFQLFTNMNSKYISNQSTILLWLPRDSRIPKR